MIFTRNDIVKYVRTLVKTPYHHQGRLPHVGLDCIGLVTSTLTHFEIPFVDVTDYPEFPDGVSMMREFRKYLTEIPLAQARTGSVVAFAFPTPELVRHCGVLTTPPAFVHTYRAVHKVVEHALNDQWRKRISAAFDFPGVID